MKACAMKTCTKCGENIPLSEFYLDKSRRDGHGPRCKPCVRFAGAEYRKRNKDKIKARDTKYREENIDKLRARDVENYWRNRTEIRSRKAEYYKRRGSRVRASVSLYRENNPDKTRAASARFRARHPEKVSAHQAVKRALYSGEIETMPCSVCGSTDIIDAHHEDYSKPLDVIWLCRKHHRRLHIDTNLSHEMED